jgi:hypothetical protein
MTYDVVTFVSKAHGAVARIRMPMPTKAEKGGSAMKLDWLPVAIHAPTEAEAADKAHAFYNAELIRLATKAENMAAGREKAAATRQAKGEA